MARLERRIREFLVRKPYGIHRVFCLFRNPTDDPLIHCAWTCSLSHFDPPQSRRCILLFPRSCRDIWHSSALRQNRFGERAYLDVSQPIYLSRRSVFYPCTRLDDNEQNSFCLLCPLTRIRHRLPYSSSSGLWMTEEIPNRYLSEMELRRNTGERGTRKFVA